MGENRNGKEIIFEMAEKCSQLKNDAFKNFNKT
jgi:hypothetical protein